MRYCLGPEYIAWRPLEQHALSAWHGLCRSVLHILSVVVHLLTDALSGWIPFPLTSLSVDAGQGQYIANDDVRYLVDNPRRIREHSPLQCESPHRQLMVHVVPIPRKSA